MNFVVKQVKYICSSVLMSKTSANGQSQDLFDVDTLGQHTNILLVRVLGYCGRLNIRAL